ncbi:MAG: hypothetical protein FWF49_03975 [Oscillospiraceae bacterium]|nr:hypothetical protein [Oscillospiraceae bacterium]
MNEQNGNPSAPLGSAQNPLVIPARPQPGGAEAHMPVAAGPAAAEAGDTPVPAAHAGETAAAANPAETASPVRAKKEKPDKPPKPEKPPKPPKEPKPPREKRAKKARGAAESVAAAAAGGIGTDGTGAAAGNTSVAQAAGSGLPGSKRVMVLGFIVLLLAAFGLYSLGAIGVDAIRRAADPAPLQAQLMDFLTPVFQFTPPPFGAVDENAPDALLEAAVWRVTNAEYIRMLQTKSDTPQFDTDEFGRWALPLTTVEESYRTLFGPDAPLPLHTIGDPGSGLAYEYDDAHQLLYVPNPTMIPSLTYTPVSDTMQRINSSRVVLRVGFVSNNSLQIDDKGGLIPPTPAMADYFQRYIVDRTPDGWKLTAVESEQPIMTTAVG